MNKAWLLFCVSCLVALGALALSSCAGVEIPKEVKVQVPVACVDPAELPQRPPLRSESDLLAMDRYRRTLAAWSDLKRLEAYSAELEAIAASCSRIPAAAPRRRRELRTASLEELERAHAPERTRRRRKPIEEDPQVTAAPKGERIGEGCYRCRPKTPRA